MNISNSEVQKLEKIGSGNFGTIYRSDDKVLKIYHDKIKAYDEIFCIHEIIDNPSLKYNLLKYEYLKRRNFKLKNTDLINDILFVDGMFKGVVMPYYNGDILEKHLSDNLDKKVSLAKQLLVNAKELTDNYIYPLDYKSDNIMLCDNKIQIIDLDDVKTKILNPAYKIKSVKTLDKAIKCFLGDIDYNSYININKNYIRSYLEKKDIKINNSYKEIENYLNNIVIKNDYILADDKLDLVLYLYMLRNPNYRVIYVYNNEKIENRIKEMLLLGIKVYDIIPESSLPNFLTSISYDKLFINKEKKLTKI